MQNDALRRKFLLDRARHMSSPFGLELLPTPIGSGPLCFAHHATTCKGRPCGQKRGNPATFP